MRRVKGSQLTAVWFLCWMLSALLRASAPAPAPPATSHVVVYNDTAEIVTLWTRARAPQCAICPEAPLWPGEQRRLAVAPGPVTWEVVVAPYGDLYTAYRLDDLAVTVPSVGTVHVNLSGGTPAF